MKTRRLFFALWPDRRKLERLRNAISPLAKLVEGRAVDRRDWHITLQFIGEFPEADIPALLERVRQIQVAPFTLSFDKLEYWPRPRVASLVASTVPNDMQRLVEQLTDVVADFGIITETRAYRPHITVTRASRPFETQHLAQRERMEWSAFDLIESVREPGGARYRVLKQ